MPSLTYLNARVAAGNVTATAASSRLPKAKPMVEELHSTRNTSPIVPGREIGWEIAFSGDGAVRPTRLCYIHYVRRAGFVSKKLMRSWATGLITFYGEHPLKIAVAAMGIDFTNPSIVSPASNQTSHSAEDIAFGPDYIGAGISNHKPNLSPLLVIALLEDSHSSDSISLPAAQLQKIAALADGHALPILLVYFEKQHSDHGSGNHDASESSHEIHAAKVQLLAHLANGQADEWFHLRLGAHRHSDDVDHEAEEHAVEQEMQLLAQEISAELHMHLQELHRHFAEWWIESHGHDGKIAAAEDAIDGQDHEHHDYTGSFGRHVAEYYWAFVHEQHLAREDWHEHIHHQHMHSEDSAHEASGHADIAFEAEELDDHNGSRHGYHGQADSWWMYRGGKHGSSSHATETSSHGESNISVASGLSDWHRIELDISPYQPPVKITTAVMAGHELPPTE